MFYIKYLYPHGQELLAGPFDKVSAEWTDESGTSYDHVAAAKLKPEDRPKMWRMVHAYNEADGHNLTMGPNVPANPDDRPSSQARVYVMSMTGDTLAKYEL